MPKKFARVWLKDVLLDVDVNNVLFVVYMWTPTVPGGKYLGRYSCDD